MSDLIGVVGGIGPISGQSLHAAILANTRAVSDSDHLQIVVYTNPQITDPTAYLEGDVDINPADEILQCLRELAQFGCRVLCVPSNTAAVGRIWEPVEEGVRELPQQTELLRTVGTVVEAVVHHYPDVSHIGLAANEATVESGVYQEAFGRHNVATIVPTPGNQQRIQETIHHPDWGTKARVRGASGEAIDALETAAFRMIADGAEAIVIGSTELTPVACRCDCKGVPMVDSTDCLARAAIVRAGGEGKLRAVPRTRDRV